MKVLTKYAASPQESKNNPGKYWVFNLNSSERELIKKYDIKDIFLVCGDLKSNGNGFGSICYINTSKKPELFDQLENITYIRVKSPPRSSYRVSNNLKKEIIITKKDFEDFISN